MTTRLLAVVKRIRSVVVAGILVALPVAAGGSDDLATSTEYVHNLPATCAYDDAYQCRQVEEDNFLSRESDSAMVPGAYLAAWQGAMVDFLGNDELTDEQKQLKHYKFGFTENDTHFIVQFRALLLPRLVDGKVAGIIRSTAGRTTRYWVDKQTLEVTRRLYER